MLSIIIPTVPIYHDDTNLFSNTKAVPKQNVKHVQCISIYISLVFCFTASFPLPLSATKTTLCPFKCMCFKFLSKYDIFYILIVVLI